MAITEEQLKKLHKLADKIENLRQLAKRSPFPEEADTAEKMARTLIEKYKRLPGGLQYIFYSVDFSREGGTNWKEESNSEKYSSYGYSQSSAEDEDDDFNDDEMDEDEEELNRILEKYRNLRKYHVKDFDRIPISDGIFLVFEEGESFNGLDRVVYVGKNLRKGRLVNVIKRNFWEGNKESAELRKFIGAALLSQRNDPFLNNWMNKESEPWDERIMNVENEVTRYMANHMWVAVLPEEDKDVRKEKWISLIRQFKLSYSLTSAVSENWLGNDSNEFIIREYGMWQKSFNP